MNNKTNNSFQKGFSLIELMVVVSIIVILARIAIPTYTKSIARSNRVAAITFLLNLSNKQAQYMLDKHQYFDTTVQGTLYPTPSVVSANYTITVTPDNTAAPPSYTAIATPTSSQLSRDNTCGALQIDQFGVNWIKGSGTSFVSGTTTVRNCWSGK